MSIHRPKRAKRYRPKPVGRPIMKKIRDELILPAYVALHSVQFGSDPDELEPARHSLAALMDYMLVALQDAGRDAGPISRALDALMPMVRRYDAGQSFRGTAAELEQLRNGVDYADQILGTLRTDHIIAAVHKVNRAIDAMAAASTPSPCERA